MNASAEFAGDAASVDASQEQLIADFKAVMTDAEALLQATANKGDEKLDEARAKTRESLRVIQARIAESQAAVLARSKEAAKATDIYVHQNPWTSLLVAGGIGLLTGLLLRRH